MKTLRIFGLIIFLANVSYAQDTLKEVQPGVIYVKKPEITPYIKVNYKLYLSKVSVVPVDVPVTDPVTGFVEMQRDDQFPVYDSSHYTSDCIRIYPKKTELFSKYFAENLEYKFLPADTPKTDTLRVIMRIDKDGKIRRVDADPLTIGSMPVQLARELIRLSYNAQQADWGTGGGWNTQESFLHPSKFTSEEYCAELFVIVSNRPLTIEQKNTGASYAPFDYPLNCPGIDDQQINSMIRNGYLKE